MDRQSSLKIDAFVFKTKNSVDNRTYMYEYRTYKYDLKLVLTINTHQKYRSSKMKLIQRLTTLFKSTTHDVLDHLEGPGTIERQMVRNLSIQIAQTEEDIAEVWEDEKSLCKKYKKTIEAIYFWHSEAEKAIKVERDDLALAALAQAHKSEQLSLTYKASLSILTPKVSDLKEKLEELRKIKEKYAHESILLDMCAKTDHASTKAIQIVGNIGNSPLGFDSKNQNVDKMEGKSEALKKLSDLKQSPFSEKDFIQLDLQSTLQEKLKRMKEELTGKQLDDVS